mmetsp:Transcript_18811/g.36884  ORF Transcript_18811/g.36884 Transcript_18811/m.36884 type:complete len:291 (+) Transcript_18811:537-1409(+)
MMPSWRSRLKTALLISFRLQVSRRLKLELRLNAAMAMRSRPAHVSPLSSSSLTPSKKLHAQSGLLKNEPKKSAASSQSASVAKRRSWRRAKLVSASVKNVKRLKKKRNASVRRPRKKRNANARSVNARRWNARLRGLKRLWRGPRPGPRLLMLLVKKSRLKFSTTHAACRRNALAAAKRTQLTRPPVAVVNTARDTASMEKSVRLICGLETHLRCSKKLREGSCRSSRQPAPRVMEATAMRMKPGLVPRMLSAAQRQTRKIQNMATTRSKLLILLRKQIKMQMLMPPHKT